jgi:hypothetical protein
MDNDQTISYAPVVNTDLLIMRLRNNSRNVNREAARRPVNVRRVLYVGAVFNCLPVVVLVCLWQLPLPVPLFVAGIVIFLFFFLAARWDLTGYHLRYILLLALFLIVYQQEAWWALSLLVGAVGLMMLVLRQPPRIPAIGLQFPLQGAMFCIVQGGNARWLNHHRISKSQRFALDIVALQWYGSRARGIYPARLRDYRIFGEMVYSPCSGTVTATLNGLPDEPPGRMDRSNPAGNYVIIRPDASDIYVGLAHLMNGSVVVRPGDRVAAGQFIARTGNSGNTSEPHLHIHAKRGGRPTSMLDGEGVPMLFTQRWLVRNALISKPKRT